MKKRHLGDISLTSENSIYVGAQQTERYYWAQAKEEATRSAL